MAAKVYRRDEKIIGTIARNIKKHRKAQGLTIQELADKIDLDGHFYGQISKIERRIVNPSVSIVSIIAAALDIKPSILLKDDDE